MRRLVTSRLIRICTVCHSVFDFTLKPLFEAVEMSKFKDGRVHSRNSRMTGINYGFFFFFFLLLSCFEWHCSLVSFLHYWSSFRTALTIVPLTKIRLLISHFLFSDNQITWSRLLIQTHVFNNKECRSSLLASEANWSGSTLFAKAERIRVQQDQV